MAGLVGYERLITEPKRERQALVCLRLTSYMPG